LRQQVRLAGTLTPSILWLLGLNAGLFVLQNAFPPLTPLLAVVPGRVLNYPHTLLTYAFLHGSVGHLLFNMIMLYFFGGDLDLFLGRRRFWVLYLGSALAGGLAAALFLPAGVMVLGASGAIYGLLTAYALYFPDTEILVWFVFPMKTRTVVLVLLAVSLFYSVFGSVDGVAHLAHLGGAAFAFLYVSRAWRPSSLVRNMRHRWRRRRFTRIQ
jgi:membrane associated rhomboid family serine protease